MRIAIFILFLALLMIGCSGGSGNPSFPEASGNTGFGVTVGTAKQIALNRYCLWGEWLLYINAKHDHVDIVPMREGRFHLNALKFLEQYCADCLKITSITNNGDGSIDLSVKITHPFPDSPEYTGFDVKGIIMFDGSCLFPYEDGLVMPIPNPIRVSWKELGDPEVLNPDGYTHRWSPTYDSESNLPIFNYWQGKYATGTPSANLNAFLNFYSLPERHIFFVDSSITRTYTIWLPPGQPVVAGYAVEASWVPPIVTPVTNPLEDFPTSANQPDAYLFNVVVNDGNLITDCLSCCGHDLCKTLYAQLKTWQPDPWPGFLVLFSDGAGYGVVSGACPSPLEDAYMIDGFSSCAFGNGKFRALAVHEAYLETFPDLIPNFAFDIFDFAIDNN